jgi:hypothetical protein
MKSSKLNTFFLIFSFLYILPISINLTPSYEQYLTPTYTCSNLTKIISKNNHDLISLMKSNITQFKSQSHSCIDTLVKYAKIPVLDFYLNELCNMGVEYKENLEISLNTVLTQINDVYNKHKYSETQYQTVFPASKWAQSMDEVFIEVKFAHRHDSPGCLEMKNLKVELKERSVKLIGYCVLGDVPIKMDFDIKLWNKINVRESKHFESSVGRYQFNLVKKKKDNYWKKLMDDKMSIPSNMRVWFEMKEKYQEQLEKYENDEFDEELKDMMETIKQEEKKKDNKKNKTKTKKKKKKKKSKTNTTDL